MNLNFLINVAIGILLVLMIFSLMNRKKNSGTGKTESRYEKIRAVNRKNDEDMLGRRFNVPREGNKEDVKVNLYEISSEHPTPVVYVLHGGNLMDGDADQTDTFCHRLSVDNECMVVSINYTKLDVQRPPYQQDEIIDTVEYFASRNTYYHINPAKTAFVGFSGGAYLMMGAAAILGTKGRNIRGMIAFYPLIDDSLIQLVDQCILRTPVTFVTCDNEKENEMVETLRKHMELAGVEADVKRYPSAMTGFIEVNNPEYENNRYYQKGREAMYSEDQKDYARACKIWMRGELEGYFENER